MLTTFLRFYIENNKKPFVHVFLFFLTFCKINTLKFFVLEVSINPYHLSFKLFKKN